MTLAKSLTAVAAVALLAAGCASSGSKKEEQTSSLPQWVMNPTVENGIAATECVKSTGDLSMDKSKAVALGRQALVQQISTRVQSMEKTYERSVEASDATNTGRTFQSVSKQLADKQVQGSRAIKVKYVDIDGNRNLCAMTALNPGQTKKLFDKILKNSQRDVPAKDKEILYEQFKADKAQQALDKEMESDG